MKKAVIFDLDGTLANTIESPVSYTHLDVYKRQQRHRTGKAVSGIPLRRDHLFRRAG